MLNIAAMKYDLKSKVSMNEVEGILIVTVNPDLDEATLVCIQESVLNTIATQSINGVVLNFSEVEILDSFLIVKLEEITKMIEVMGAIAVVAGMRPEIVVSLVTLNINPRTLTTALNLESAIKMLREIVSNTEGDKEDENLEMEETNEQDEVLDE